MTGWVGRDFGNDVINNNVISADDNYAMASTHLTTHNN